MQNTPAIWIDLDNSPHVPLFVPIIRHYLNNCVEVIVTAREHAQTTELLEMHSLSGTCTVVGSHYGKSRINKVRGLLVRSKQLVSHITKQHQQISVAISHGSRSMVLAARWLKIPVITMYDYEFTETSIFNRFSDKVIVPDSIADAVLDEIGLPRGKRRKYAGIKEELYVRGFENGAEHREQLCHDLSIDPGSILAVLRPPATTANYHSEKSEVLLHDLLRFLLAAGHVTTIVVPRTGEQKREIEAAVKQFPDSPGKVVILDQAIDGLELIAAADLVISGGGTMNREAVLLGVPVYSIFAGRQGALDRQMESDGRITFIRDARDLSKIRLEKRPPAGPQPLTERVERFVIKEIDSFL